jgi:hypothetical protein
LAGGWRTDGWLREKLLFVWLGLLFRESPAVTNGDEVGWLVVAVKRYVRGGWGGMN